jgi:hypothetical protein
VKNSIPEKCPKCGSELDSVIFLCKDLNCIAGIIPLNRSTSPEQDISMERESDRQVTEVIGKTIKCDPEYAVVKFFKWLINFKQNNKV